MTHTTATLAKLAGVKETDMIAFVACVRANMRKGDSYEVAIKRHLNTVRKLAANPELAVTPNTLEVAASWFYPQ